MCPCSDVSRSFETNSGLACAEGRLSHAVLCEAREEPFERPLPDLVVDLCSPPFLQDCVAVNADSQDYLGGRTPYADLGRAGRARARMTSALLSGWSVINCRDPTATPSVMLPSVTAEVFNSSLGWRCIQVVHVVDDFCFQRISLSSDSSIGDVEVLEKRQHQD